MFNDETTTLHSKYMAFNELMLEEYSPLEIAAILVIQGLGFYKTIMSDDDYHHIVKMIYDQRNSIHTFD
jgi:hypothetical protein